MRLTIQYCIVIDMSTVRNPGRPRAPEIEAAILAAAARLLTEQGYARMSIIAIAAAAGVSRPAIYRRFKTKADLAIAALASQIDDQARPSADLDVEAALTWALEHLARRLRAKHSMALVGTLLVEEGQTPESVPPEKVLEGARIRLAEYKVPRFIEYVTTFPYTPSQKVAKAKLVAQADNLRANSWDALA